MVSLKQNDSVLGIDGHLSDSKRQKRLNYGTVDGGAKTMDHCQSDLQAQNIVTSDCQLRSQNGASLAGTGLLVTSENMNGNRAICEFCQSSKISEATGMMLHYINGKPVTGDASFGSNVIHVHSSCIEWAPQVYFVGDNVKNLKPELAKGAKLNQVPNEKSRKAHSAAKFPNKKPGNCLSADDKVPTESFTIDEISLDNHGCCDGPKTGRLRVLDNAPKLFDYLAEG
ncbi:breast cancer susceptibility 1 -like protein [Gossypium arboreum]|uniref:Breast cancer susceptibility 1-like protein n=1 Tax=Gossypium arboreum TaxID=29729 RepID=A0A0B0NJZ1_GOSAR|nr:breast cancer susceptibility 1 -like protein [Gossypium arboreum]